MGVTESEVNHFDVWDMVFKPFDGGWIFIPGTGITFKKQVVHLEAIPYTIKQMLEAQPPREHLLV